jgi:hypothetical protein
MDTENEVPATQEPLTGVSNFANRIGARNLLIIIVTMPLAFLIVVMGVIAVAGKPGKEEETVTAGAVRSTPAEYADVLEQPARQTVLPATPASLFAEDAAPLVLPEGAKIGSMTLDGDRLAVRIDRQGGGEILIYDIARGGVIQRIRVTQADSEEDL